MYWARERDRIDKPRLRTHVRVCACLLLSLDLCTLRARNGRPTYGIGLLSTITLRSTRWERWHIPTYPSAPNLHDNFPRVEVIALDDLLYAGGRTVEPEIMLGVSEDANVGFELRHSGRHGRIGGRGWC